MDQVFNCLIVDDDDVDRLTTVSFVRKYPFLKITGLYTAAEDALEFALKNPPDVLFLDIDMPGISGLEMREALLHGPACIFITAYPDYAVESFEKDALDFLVKPLTGDRWDMAMGRLQNYLTIRQKAELFDHSLGGDSLFIKDGHEQIKINLHEIVYLEALKDYTGIITGKKKYCVLSPLGNLLKDKAFSTFIRIHRSYAVQKHFIDKITAQQVFVNKFTLPVGRSYKDLLDELTHS